MEKALTLTRALAQVSTRKQLAQARFDADLEAVANSIRAIQDARQRNEFFAEELPTLISHVVTLASAGARVEELRIIIETLLRNEL